MHTHALYAHRSPILRILAHSTIPFIQQQAITATMRNNWKWNLSQLPVRKISLNHILIEISVRNQSRRHRTKICAHDEQFASIQSAALISVIFTCFRCKLWNWWRRVVKLWILEQDSPKMHGNARRKKTNGIEIWPNSMKCYKISLAHKKPAGQIVADESIAVLCVPQYRAILQ